VAADTGEYRGDPAPSSCLSSRITVTFAAGLSTGRLCAAYATHSPDLAAEAGIMRVDNPNASNRRLYPFRQVVDGTPTNVEGVRPAGPRWRLDLANGRVIVFTSEGAGGVP
jgi:hypothetical protein